jgi:hypothetical protein
MRIQDVKDTNLGGIIRLKAGKMTSYQKFNTP